MNASRQPLVVSAALCVALAALFAARYVLAPPSFDGASAGMPLAVALSRLCVELPWLAVGIAAVVVVWTLALITQLGVKYGPAGSRNFLPSQIWLIAAGSIVVSGEALAPLICAWLVATGTRRFIFSLSKGYRFEDVFRAGLCFGLIPLLWAPAAAVAVVVVPSMLAILKRSAREWVVCLVALMISVPAAGFIHWALGAEADFIYTELWRNCTDTTFSFQLYLPREMPSPPLATVGARSMSSLLPALRSTFNFLPVAGGLLLAAIGVVWALGHKKGMRKTPYKFMTGVAVLLASLLASAAIPGGASPVPVPMVGVAAAIAVPWAFSGKWASVSTLVYCLVLASVLALNLSEIVSF